MTWDERDKHNKTAALPAATTVTCDPLRPLDLIIQDELHLIAGPLGTLMGLYEAAIDRLAALKPALLVCTDTVPQSDDLPFRREVVSIAPLLADAVRAST